LVPLIRLPAPGGARSLAERAAEFVYGLLQQHPEGDSRHAHWREVTEIVQKTRRRKMERRHLLR